MNYPLISEYVEAIKSAEENFEELSYLRPVLGDDGLPVMSAGGFSVVFKMKDKQSGKLYAVKCFTKEQEGRSESYKLIADELEFVSSNYLTPIKYLEKELFVDSSQTLDTEFPVLLMDWIEGKTLDKYIFENLGDQYALEMLTYRFCKLAMWLLTQPFAHGDLKPDNILVNKDGSIVLVDYDGMYVPAMKRQKARELGSPNFRHPQRTEEQFDENIDDFTIALIALSLKTFCLNKNLINDYCTNDYFIFKEKDYAYINSCEAMTSILNLAQDKELQSLLGAFMIALANNSLSFVSHQLLSLKNPKLGLAYGESLYNQARSLCDDADDKSNLDYNKAFILFKKAANIGNAEAQCCVGCCYKHGYGTQVDYSEARAWYDKSIKNGCARAMRHIAMSYRDGLGVEKDIYKAIEWSKKASEKGDKRSMVLMGTLYYYGRGGVAVNYEEAVNMYSMAAEKGDSDGMWRLALCYEKGKGIEKDFEKSFEWFKKSAEKNNPNGLFGLGECYLGGYGIEKNYKEAVALYEKAANLGHKGAIEKLNSLKYDQLPFPVIPETGISSIPYPEPKESVKRKIRKQFLSVDKDPYYSYFAIINTLICKDSNSSSGLIRSIWIPSEIDSHMSVKMVINGKNAECTYSLNGVVSSFIHECNSWNIEDVVDLTYELFNRLGLVGYFISNGAEAINKMNEIKVLNDRSDDLPF